MATKKGKKVLIRLMSSESRHYYTVKKSRGKLDKLEMKKFDPVLRKHVMYKEHKIK